MMSNEEETFRFQVEVRPVGEMCLVQIDCIGKTWIRVSHLDDTVPRHLAEAIRARLEGPTAEEERAAILKILADWPDEIEARCIEAIEARGRK